MWQTYYTISEMFEIEERVYKEKKEDFFNVITHNAFASKGDAHKRIGDMHDMLTEIKEAIDNKEFDLETIIQLKEKEA